MTTTTWQETLAASVKKAEQGEKAKKQAGILLWDGAVEAITEFVDNATNDPQAEQLQSDVTAAMGERRRGDASKIKTVALAVVNNGLVLADYANLSQAYKEATARTKTVKAHAAEDEAADAVTSSLTPPKSTSAAEGAAQMLLAKGVDEAARILLSVMGAENHLAHRAFIRAVAQEAAGLIPKPEPKPKAEKKAPAKPKAKKAPAKKASEKAPAPAKKASPSKPAKKAAAPVAPVADMFDDLDDETTEAPAPVKKAVAKPVRKGPVRR